MPDAIALEYLSLAPFARLAVFVLGAFLAHFFTREEMRIARLRFSAFLGLLYLVTILALGLIWAFAPAYWTGENSARLTLQDIESSPANSLILIISLIGFELTVYAACGFFLWVVASARSRDASGANGWAIRCFLPFVNLVALPYLLFKSSKDREIEGYIP